jgi:hypothetical protein
VYDEPADVPAPVVDAAPKKKRGRPARAKVTADELLAAATVAADDDATAAEVPAPAPAPKVYTEAESSAEAMRIAKDFVQRFSGAIPDGLTRAKAILKDMGVQKIGDLTHDQRLSFITALNAGMEVK